MAPFITRSAARLMILLLLVFFTDNVISAKGKATLPQPVVRFVVQSHYLPGFPVKEQLSGYLGKRYYANLEKRLLEIDEKAMLKGFITRPGEQDWIGEHVGKYLETAANTWEVTKNPQLKVQMDRIAATLMSTQLPDGYLGTYIPSEYWTSWDVWVHKYDLYGLLAYYRITGNPKALTTCKRVGDLLCRTFGNGPGQRDIIKAGEHVGMAATSVLDAMAELYRWTGDKKYLGFCNYIISAYDQEDGPHIIKTLLTEKQVNKVANGKAYEMLSNLVGIMKMYRLTGHSEYLQAAQNAFADITAKRLYITGTASDHEVFKDDDVLSAGIDADMGEGCVTTTWIQLNTQLFSVTGDTKYFDEIEKSIYNHLLGAENPQSGCVSYYTPLIGKKPYSCEITCCLSSVARGIAFIPYYNYAKIDHIPTILLYEPASITDTINQGGKHLSIKLDIESSFPQSGHSVIHVNSLSGSKTFTLQLRAPKWSTNFKAVTGGKTYTLYTSDLLKLTRTWMPGDKIDITFDIPVKELSGGKSYPNTIAFQRGPQILAYDESFNKTPADGLRSIRTASCCVIDEAVQFPKNWVGSGAYSFTASEGEQKLILVPFADAGQSGGKVTTWLPAQ